MVRKRITIEGIVQGVGFRPFVFNLANRWQLSGFILNDSHGVTMEVEGNRSTLRSFIHQLKSEKPPLARYHRFLTKTVPAKLDRGFNIRASHAFGKAAPWVLPDITICPDCVKELTDPGNHRYRYPFINCTNCGPRFSIIDSLPYDRPQTTMRSFEMCQVCRQEYIDPSNRRFHAQPIACPDCGPAVRLLTRTGKPVKTPDCITAAVKLLRDGYILALKGLGGYQVLVDATNDTAVGRLRDRKHRPDKPFAVMFPDLRAIKQAAQVPRAAVKFLTGNEMPIVILKKKPSTGLAPSVAPDSGNVGALLPYTPLHRLIMDSFGKPLVCTSANIAGEPIITDDKEAIVKLASLVDYYVIHDRPIRHHVDDSVMRLADNKPLPIRRARGYVPLPLLTKQAISPLIALGAEQKSAIAVSHSRSVFVSQHIGDLDSAASIARFKSVIEDYRKLFGITPVAVACDAHPAYESTLLADTFGLPVIPVYHHEAHIASCLLDNRFDGEVLGIAWDGTGVGPDGTIWGGEFLLNTPKSTERIASLKPFLLLGGEQAAKEPKRVALSLLYELYGAGCFSHPWVIAHFTAAEIAAFRTMIEKKLNVIQTTSMGRLFDGVAALLNFKDTVSYEGQAAMMLEDSVIPTAHVYPFSINETTPWHIDWAPTVEAILEEIKNQVNYGLIAGTFHRTLAEMIITVAKKNQIKNSRLKRRLFSECLFDGTGCYSPESESDSAAYSPAVATK